MAELSLDWSEGGYVKVPTDRPVRFFFQFGDPRPSFAEELTTDLMTHTGEIHRSRFPYLPIVVRMRLKRQMPSLLFTSAS
jgi:hypothetical protein